MDEQIIERLRDPDCYPGRPGDVEIYQTHLSVVCLAGDFAYKLKKPIKLPFVDFSTLALREHYCYEEIRLNRRLCPDLYLNVVPLLPGKKGVTFRDGDGEAVDYAVRMKRLPQDKMLNELLERNEVEAAGIREVARIMAAFHSGLERDEDLRAVGNPKVLQQFALDNFRDTREMRGRVFDETLHRLMQERARADLDRWLPVLEQRASCGRIVEGHGDLHARNVCMTDPPTIYDCLEFSAQLRCGDVATENAFLVMDLIYRGHPELARVYLETYIEESGDEEQRQLMPLLVRYRAMVRAKVSGIASGEEELSVAEREQALQSAKKHLNLAAASAIAEVGPVLILACGLPGTGKSYVFEELARECAWPIVSSDRVRKNLAGIPEQEHLIENFYSADFSRRTYAAMLAQAEDRLRIEPVLVDANFRSVELRKQAYEVAKQAGASIVVVWFRVEDEVVKNRLERRNENGKTVSDAGVGVYEKLKDQFEPPTAGEEFEVFEVDGGLPREANVVRILAHLVGR